MSTIVLNVPGINCGHCVHTIQTELSEMEGVTEVVASFVTKQTTVSFESPASEEAIKSLLTEINYPATN
jgi:copper chaperone CopZ